MPIKQTAIKFCYAFIHLIDLKQIIIFMFYQFVWNAKQYSVFFLLLLEH